MLHTELAGATAYVFSGCVGLCRNPSVVSLHGVNALGGVCTVASIAFVLTMPR